MKAKRIIAALTAAVFSFTLNCLPIESLTTRAVESAGSVAIDEAHFPDAVFRQYVSDNIDTDGDGVLSEEEILACTEIIVTTDDKYANGHNYKLPTIYDLTGIEYFSELTWLECTFNGLTSLDISKNTKLTTLLCYSNKLTNLDVSNNTLLQDLSCNDNQLTSLDVSNNTLLVGLTCERNNLTSLDVSNNTSLTTLQCRENQLTSLDVSNNTSLDYLDCAANGLKVLDVSSNTLLRMLYCADNQLTNLDVSNNTLLEIFYCENNQLTSLDASASTNTSLVYNMTCRDNSYYIGEVSDSFDLSELPGNFDASRAYDWTGAEYDEATNSLINFTDTTVKYIYIVNDDYKEWFTLTCDIAHKHSFEGDYLSDKNGHWQKCDCGELSDAEPHTPSEWISDTDAATDNSAVRYKECTVCGLILETEEITFDDGQESSEEVETAPDAAPEDSVEVVTITVPQAFKMKDKNGNDVELDITNIKIKAKEIYDDPEMIKRAEQALGIDINPNRHYNLLDLTLWNGDSDISNDYNGLVRVVIPIPKGHVDKNFTVVRLVEDANGNLVKETIPCVREGDDVVIYLEHFSVYALVETEALDPDTPNDTDTPENPGNSNNPATGFEAIPGAIIAVAAVSLGTALMTKKKR